MKFKVTFYQMLKSPIEEVSSIIVTARDEEDADTQAFNYMFYNFEGFWDYKYSIEAMEE